MKKIVMMAAMVMVMATAMPVMAREAEVPVEQTEQQEVIEETAWFEELTYEFNYCMKELDREEAKRTYGSVDYEARKADYRLELIDGSIVDAHMEDEQIKYYMYNAETGEYVSGKMSYEGFYDEYM